MSTLPRRLSPTAKRLLITGAVIGALILIYTLRTILPPFIVALVVAYVLNPVVGALVGITRRSRSVVVGVIYLALAVALVWAIMIGPPALLRQIRDININMEAIASQMSQLLMEYQYIEISGYVLDLGALTGEIPSLIQRSASFLAGRAGSMAMGLMSGLAWAVVTLLVSFYLVRDAPQANRFFQEALQADYQADYVRLTGEINAVLSNYLRGQVVLGLTIGFVTGLSLAILGVHNAVLFGILAGLLEVIPTIGPIIAAIPAVASAFFQGSSNFAIENHWFAVIVIVLYVIIQQLENNLLVPRIIGRSVSLHPVIIIFGVMAGATIAGLLGALLAVPTITIGRILIGYLAQKLAE